MVLYWLIELRHQTHSRRASHPRVLNQEAEMLIADQAGFRVIAPRPGRDRVESGAGLHH